MRGHARRCRVRLAQQEALRAQQLCTEPGEGQDKRTFGTNYLRLRGKLVAPTVSRFATDPYLEEVAEAYLQMHVKKTALPMQTLVSSTSPGTCSGGGWHKDLLTPGFKALMYLTDVGEERHGAFAMLLGYNDSTLHFDASDPKKRKTRFTDAEVQEQVRRGAQIHPILGRAGTVVVFETSSVHRGLRSSSSRIAMTNYYSNNQPMCAPVRASAGETSALK